ncbi:MAG: YraN family protein [Endomicrobiales bacterium]|nr:YraN family protein [Endomicrobiales bacterium]
MNKREAGIAGERFAAKYLKKNGYEILESNYRCPFGEIDIVCRDGKYLVFVEVKSRRGGQFGRPQEAVDRRKREKIVKSAASYLKIHPGLPRDTRFDVLAVGPGENEAELIKAAFMSEKRYTL